LKERVEKYLTNFKKVVLIWVKNGWFPKDPFIHFNLAKREVERPFLTRAKLETIISREFPTERLNYVRGIFLFSCFTGLAFVDLQKLKRSEVGVGPGGEKWRFTKRQKTKTQPGGRLHLLLFLEYKTSLVLKNSP
jgi:hypothetical protein